MSWKWYLSVASPVDWVVMLMKVISNDSSDLKLVFGDPLLLLHMFHLWNVTLYPLHIGKVHSTSYNWETNRYKSPI
jgi:hypothetical protein